LVTTFFNVEDSDHDNYSSIHSAAIFISTLFMQQKIISTDHCIKKKRGTKTVKAARISQQTDETICMRIMGLEVETECTNQKEILIVGKAR
jgi:ribosomal protein L27